jgi:hypothetical protein
VPVHLDIMSGFVCCCQVDFVLLHECAENQLRINNIIENFFTFAGRAGKVRFRMVKFKKCIESLFFQFSGWNFICINKIYIINNTFLFGKSSRESKPFAEVCMYLKKLPASRNMVGKFIEKETIHYVGE